MVSVVRELAVTPREAEVLLAVTAGLTNAQIARRLQISVATVVKHLEHAYPKLAVSNRTSAAVLVAQAVRAEPLPHRVPDCRLSKLTRREVQVLRGVRAGLTNVQISSRLGVSHRTVGKHLEHVYAKMGFTNRAAAVALLTQCSAGPPPLPVVQ